MRYVLLCWLMVNFCAVNGQTICEDVNPTTLYGDYPPGCNLCFSLPFGTNMGYTPDDTISYDFPCGEVENSVWYSFYGRGRGFVNPRIIVNGCVENKGLEAVIFDKELNRVSDCVFIDPQRSRGIAFSDLQPEPQIYYLMLDGIDGDECEFRIINNSLAGLRSDRIYVEPADANYCVGTEVCFSRGRDLGLEVYEWTVSSTDSIVSGGINEEEICFYLKTAGIKNISLKVTDPCHEENFFQSIEVNEGTLFAIDSFTAIFDKLCIDEEVRLEVDWDNDSIFLDWQVPTSHFQRLDGGFLSSNFYVGKVLSTGDVTVSVAPLSECGIRSDLNLTTGASRFESVNGRVCSGNCFTVGDSCYFINDFLGSIQVEPTAIGCDSFVFLRLESEDVFPSPNIICEQTSDGVLVEWEKQSGVDSIIVFINRDSILTTANDSFLIENIPNDLLFDLKIQPIGDCSYLPAEIKCRGLVSTNSNFVNNKINVYPNPTTGNLTIETDLKIEEINVFDLSGRFIQNEKNTFFELKKRVPGIYFLKIKTEEGVGVKRVLIN